MADSSQSKLAARTNLTLITLLYALTLATLRRMWQSQNVSTLSLQEENEDEDEDGHGDGDGDGAVTRLWHEAIFIGSAHDLFKR